MTDLSDSKIVLYNVREGISLNHRPPTPVRVCLHLFLLDVRRSALSLAFLRDKAEARAPRTHSAYAVRAVGARAPHPEEGPWVPLGNVCGPRLLEQHVENHLCGVWS